MKVIDDGSGNNALHVDDSVVDALQALGRALTAAGMSARVRLMAADEGGVIEMMLGKDQRDGPRVMRAMPSTGEGSRLGIDETEGY